jgi:hypothetical protein
MKRKKQRRDAEGRRNPRHRALRDIEDKEWEGEFRHLDEELTDWPEDEAVSEDSDDDYLPSWEG